MPRIRSLDDAKRADVIALVASGLTIIEAARYVGCHSRTIHRTVASDEQFRRELSAAQLTTRLDPEKLMHQAAGAHWRAAAWLLERRDPQRYARRQADSCDAEQVRAIAERLIETALEQIRDEVTRRRVYLCMVEVQKTAVRELFPGRAPKARRPLQPFIEHQRIDDDLEDASAYFQSFRDSQKDELEQRIAALKMPTANPLQSSAESNCPSEQAKPSDNSNGPSPPSPHQDFGQKPASSSIGGDQSGDELSPKIDLSLSRTNAA